MVGINGLHNMTLADFSLNYRLLVDSIFRTIPAARIYLHNILPVGEDKEKLKGANTKILQANRIIADIALLY